MTIIPFPPPDQRIDQLLDSVGNGTGTTEQATTADEYMFKPTVNVILERMLVGIEDDAKFAAEKYGGIAALSNGILITVKDSGDNVVHTFTPKAITKTWEWGLISGSDVTPSDYTTGNDRVLIRWTFSKAGRPLVIDGVKGDYLSVNVQDDLTALVSQIMQVQGFKRS